jgi:hypothetical protein
VPDVVRILRGHDATVSGVTRSRRAVSAADQPRAARSARMASRSIGG